MKRLKERGITLVALVVTIIILLILAGVTLNLALGQDGIFSRSKVAADKYQKEQENEIGLIDEIEDKINEIETGSDVEKVTDTKPGELEEIDANTYEIGSIEDLIAFSYNVREGNTYEGKTIELKQSLDFSSNKSYVNAKSTDYEKYGYTGEIKSAIENQGFIPIGSMRDVRKTEPEKYFYGTFEGNENKIYNLKILFSKEEDEEPYAIGLFSENYGNIKNLKLENTKVDINAAYESWTGAGILVGNNRPNAIIENCSISGEINATYTSSSNTGGICGGNFGTIKNCINKASVNVIRGGIEGREARIGGIAGNSQNDVLIKNVYNMGNISFKDLKKEKEDSRVYIGGAIGANISDKGIPRMEKAFSTGKVIILEEKNTSLFSGYIGGVLGINYRENEIALDCFYLKDTVQTTSTSAQVNKFGEEKTEKELRSEEFLNLLNQDNAGAWKKDENNINDRYPILSWQ